MFDHKLISIKSIDENEYTAKQQKQTIVRGTNLPNYVFGDAIFFLAFIYCVTLQNSSFTLWCHHNNIAKRRFLTKKDVGLFINSKTEIAIEW